MSSKRFCSIWAITVLAGIVAIVGSSLWLDHYALFGDPKGKVRKVYRSERTSKYLHSFRYVPSNFDGLLLGASISANWDTSRLKSARVYNASILGANFFEEALIADNALSAGRIHWVIACVHPYLTNTHGRKSEYMTPEEYRSALGSLNLFIEEAAKLLTDHGLMTGRYNEYGAYDYTGDPDFEKTHGSQSDPNAVRRAMQVYIDQRIKSGKPEAQFSISPGALDDLRGIFATATQHGAKVLVVYPPIYSFRFEVERADWEAYWSTLATVIPPEATVLNFNLPPYDVGRADITNFHDSRHLSKKYAVYLVSELDRFLAEH